MKTKLSLVLLATLFSVGAHAGDLTVKNDSTKAIAVGDTQVQGFGLGIGAEAVAGSVLLDNACDCLNDIKSIMNTSVGAIAIGDAIAGSVVVRSAGGGTP